MASRGLPDVLGPQRSWQTRWSDGELQRGTLLRFRDSALGAGKRRTCDLRDLFVVTPTDKLPTATLIRHLTALEDRPWTDYARGHPITPRHLATLLAGFGIKAKQIRQGARTRKGYRRADFTDAFGRYLPGPKHRNTVMAAAS